MEVLWEPENGACTECGTPNCRVRRYSSSGILRTFCYPCWSTAQEPYIMSSSDWTDDDRVVFELVGFPEEERPSRAA